MIQYSNRGLKTRLKKILFLVQNVCFSNGQLGIHQCFNKSLEQGSKCSKQCKTLYSAKKTIKTFLNTTTTTTTTTSTTVGYSDESGIQVSGIQIVTVFDFAFVSNSNYLFQTFINNRHNSFWRKSSNRRGC